MRSPGARPIGSRRVSGADVSEPAFDLRAAGRVRHRADPHLLADPRRSPRHGRRHAAAGTADAARGATAKASRYSPATACRPRRSRCWRASRRPTSRRSSRRKLRVRRASSATPPARRAWSAARRIDLQAAGQAPGHGLTLDADGLRAMHARKTGAIIRASAVSGAIMAGARRRSWSRRSTSMRADVGLAFQIVDDILDVEGDAVVARQDRGQRRRSATSRRIRRCSASIARARSPPNACRGRIRRSPRRS